MYTTSRWQCDTPKRKHLFVTRPGDVRPPLVFKPWTAWFFIRGVENRRSQKSGESFASRRRHLTWSMLSIYLAPIFPDLWRETGNSFRALLENTESVNVAIAPVSRCREDEWKHHGPRSIHVPILANLDLGDAVRVTRSRSRLCDVRSLQNIATLTRWI